VRTAAAASLGWLAACAATLPILKNHQTLTTQLGTFEIHYAESDHADAEAVVRAIRNAVPRLKQWGEFREGVNVYVLQDHEELERVTGRTNYPWLRAWSRYGDVLIQAPHAWGLLAPKQSEVNELVLHELTHCLVYQLSAGPEDWSRKRIPLWFREGIAASTAEQRYRWPTLDELARFYAAHPGQDPLLGGDELYREQSNFVYAAAYHAFAFLRKRYGESAIRALMRQMQQGASFPEAFERAVGISVDAFVRDFERYLRWRDVGRRTSAVGQWASISAPS
jgi:peptidase MA superfamily protein